MSQTLHNKTGYFFQIKWFFFTNAKEDGDGTELVAGEEFGFGFAEEVFSSLGDLRGDVFEDFASSTFIKGIFAIV